MGYDKSQLTEKSTEVQINTTTRLEKLDLSFLFNYNIFPENILTQLTQWKSENRAVKIGDNIVQQVYLPPIKLFSQKIIFGVRINQIIDDVDRKGFGYETLKGHVEK